METLIYAPLALMLVVGAVVAGPVLYAAWRRITSREADLEIWRVMRRRGLARGDAAGRESGLSRAVRRCVACPSLDQCQDWLASGRKDGLDEFCPNAPFYAALEREKPLGNNR